MLRTFFSPLLLALFACGTLLSAEDPEMTTKVFKLPFNFMELGVSNDKPVVSSAPPAPAGPPAPFSDPFGTPGPMTYPSPPALTFKSSREILEETGVTFPQGTSAIFDPVTRELTVRNTPEMLDLTEAFITSHQWQGSTPVQVFSLTLVEGPGEVIRQANAAVSHRMDARPQLDALLAEAVKPDSKVRIVGEMLLQVKPGTHATTEAVIESPRVQAFDKKHAPPAEPPNTERVWEKKPPEPSVTWRRQDGMSLELESWLREDGKTMETTLSLNLGPAPPENENNDAAGPGFATPPVEEGLRKAAFQAAITMTSGSAKLIGITQPTGKDATKTKGDKDTLWAAFLTAHVRRTHTSPGVIEQPERAQEKLPPGMRAVAFQVPERLLETLIPRGTYDSPPQSLKEWLEGKDITFPAGARIEHRGGLLHVVNTSANIEIIAAMEDHAWAKAPHSVAFTLHTYQVPAAVMRPLIQKGQTEGSADDSALLIAVETAAARGQATPVSSAFFERRNGARSRHESGLERSVMTRFGSTSTADESGLVFQRQAVGTVLEIEPTVSANGRTVELTCLHELRPDPPTSQRARLCAPGALKDHDLPGTNANVLRTVTATSMASGTTMLLALHRPSMSPPETGPFGAPANSSPETLWATFLQVHVVPQVGRPEPPPRPIPKTPEQAAIDSIIEKMNKTIIPVVKFEGVSLQKAIEHLKAKSRELDASTEAGSEKGVNFIVLEDATPHEDAIYLDLLNVPVSEALRYVTELGQCAYRVKPDGVVVMHLHTVADELHTRTYKVPPDFLSIDGATPADPFAAAEADANPPKLRKTAKQILEGVGVPFPKGSSASFIASSGILVVRNTQPNLDLVEAFCDCRCVRYATSTGITAQVLQGPGPLLRRIAAQAAPLNDHRALLNELLAAVKAGTVQPLNTMRIETKSGTRITTEQGHDDAVVSGFRLDGKGGSALDLAPLFNGLGLEVEPVVAADGITISLTVHADYHTAPPVLRQEHLIDDHGRRFELPLTDTQHARLTTEFNILDGHARLLHLWKPTGKPEFEKEDVLQVMFITCDVLRWSE